MLLPTGQIPCMSPGTHTLLWGLRLNSLPMPKTQLGAFTHRDKEQLLATAPACLPFTPLVLLRQPTSLLFLLSSFPRFCAALPGISCLTQQPALPHSSPSSLLSHHFFGICCSHRSKNPMGKYQPWGPLPFTVPGAGTALSRRQNHAKGGGIHAHTSPQLGAFYSITAIKKTAHSSPLS